MSEEIQPPKTKTFDQKIINASDVLAKKIAAAHQNVREFIQPDNLKSFAESVPGKISSAKESLEKTSSNVSKIATSKKRLLKEYDRLNYYSPKTILLKSIIIMSILIWIFYYWNPFNFFSNHSQLTILFLLIVAFVQLMEVFYYRERRVVGPKGGNIKKKSQASVIDLLSKSLLTVFSVGVFVAGVYGILYAITHVPTFTTIFHWGMHTLIACGILAILYLLILPVIKAGKKEGGGKGLLDLLGALIMYVPCLIIDFVDWIKEQYEITTSTTWLVLGLTCTAIAIMILLPSAVNWMLNQDGVHLLKDPVYLNNEHQLSNHKQLEHIFKGDDEYGNTPRGYHYSISGWFWINPQPPNTRASYTKWTNILEFGGRPAIEYLGTTNELRVMCDIKGDKREEIFRSGDIPFQRWNNIVINYDGGTMDVFLNGVLVASRQAAFYQSLENVIAGADKGIEGGISNVVFYDKILLPFQIDMAYKALGRMNQPVL